MKLRSKNPTAQIGVVGVVMDRLFGAELDEKRGLP